MNETDSGKMLNLMMQMSEQMVNLSAEVGSVRKEMCKLLDRVD